MLSCRQAASTVNMFFRWYFPARGSVMPFMNGWPFCVVSMMRLSANLPESSNLVASKTWSANSGITLHSNALERKTF
jgi:hypothetical protein